MIRRVTSTLVLGAAALGLAACGSSAGTSHSASSPSGGNNKTITVRQVGGIGRVLVDRTGDALYTPDQKMMCSGACTSFWKPLSPGSGAPTAASGVGKVGVTHRPDGKSQVTVNGNPLYTFTQDSPGKVSGNGFHDAFGGQHFTWHVVLSGGKASTGGKGGSGGSHGKGNSGGGGYNYSGGGY